MQKIVVAVILLFLLLVGLAIYGFVSFASHATVNSVSLNGRKVVLVTRSPSLKSNTELRTEGDEACIEFNENKFRVSPNKVSVNGTDVASLNSESKAISIDINGDDVVILEEGKEIAKGSLSVWQKEK